MIKNLRDQVIEQILLFVTDGITGLSEVCLEVFPGAKTSKGR